MQSQGIELNDPEEMPSDPHILDRQLKIKPHGHKTKLANDRMRQFLEYDGKVLRYVRAHKTYHLCIICVIILNKYSWAMVEGCRVNNPSP